MLGAVSNLNLLKVFMKIRISIIFRTILLTFIRINKLKTHPKRADITYTIYIPLESVNVYTTIPINEKAYTTSVVSLETRIKGIVIIETLKLNIHTCICDIYPKQNRNKQILTFRLQLLRVLFFLRL